MISKVAEWVYANKDKHVCKCGCGEFITIKKHHYYKGVPEYRHHHASKVATKKIVVNCDMCGHEISKIPCFVKKHNFCNKECHNKWVSKKGTENQNYKSEKYICECCGKTIYRPPSLLSANMFCSMHCHDKWRSENVTGSDVHNYNSIEIDCVQCGTKILRTPSTIGTNNFCSRLCHSNWMSENLRGAKRYNYDGGHEASMRKRSIKRRNRGYISLNQWFDGCVGHHVDRDHIIHLPKELHNSTFLQHNYYTWANMDGQNKIAFDYLYNNLGDAMMNLEAIENLCLIYTSD